MPSRSEYTNLANNSSSNLNTNTNGNGNRNPNNGIRSVSSPIRSPDAAYFEEEPRYNYPSPAPGRPGPGQAQGQGNVRNGMRSPTNPLPLPRGAAPPSIDFSAPSPISTPPLGAGAGIDRGFSPYRDTPSPRPLDSTQEGYGRARTMNVRSPRGNHALADIASRRAAARDRDRDSPRIDNIPLEPTGYDRGRDMDFGNQPSPTHAYLEAFDSYPSTPDPSHTPIPSSASMDSPGFAGSFTEKDPLDAHHQGGFSANQYPSNRYLSPSEAIDRERSLPYGRGGMDGGNTYTTTTTTTFKPDGSRVTRSTSTGNRNIAKPYEKSRRTCIPTNPTKRRWLFWGLPIALVVLAGAALGIVFGLGLNKKGNSTNGSSGNGNGGTGNTGTNGTSQTTWFGIAGTGQNGSLVTTDLNATFTYINWYGGSWAQNPQNPYSVSGRAQSWSPSLLENWIWGQHIVRGVNLGGWLVTEPFIVPGLYESYQNSTPLAIDEFTLSQAIGSTNLANVMENHYKTFITEQDFADIAKVGLNWVRIPLGFWAIETSSAQGEPYLQGVSWKYFVKAIGWARKYGIRILLDFHGLPGSQNGWNHSGRGIGIVNWMYGVMGIANAQRSLEHIRVMTEFISQDGIKQVVPAISLVNEVQSTVVGDLNLRSFYYQAYNLIRGITGYGAGNGPIIVIHEGFEGIAQWNTFMTGADRLALDQHPYLAFGVPNNNPWDVQAKTACSWGGGVNDTQTSFGITLGGEWSNAINDCGKWLVGVTGTPTYVTAGLGSCTQWEEWFNWNSTMKAGLMSYSMATMDAVQNWFFWTWKIGNSTVLGYPPSPMWHYKLGVENGWIPTDPRVAGGYCKGIGIGGNQFAGTFPASATGAVTTSVTPSNTSAIAVWPPTSLGPSYTNTAQIALFPTLTKTGTPVTLSMAPHPSNVTNLGSGWFASSDTVKAYVTVAGCSYPFEYNATASSLVPTALCTGKSSKRELEDRAPVAVPIITPAPVQ